MLLARQQNSFVRYTRSQKVGKPPPPKKYFRPSKPMCLNSITRICCGYIQCMIEEEIVLSFNKLAKLGTANTSLNIYNKTCQCRCFPLMTRRIPYILCDNICQYIEAVLQSPPVTPTNRNDRHVINETLLKITITLKLS